MASLCFRMLFLSPKLRLFQVSSFPARTSLLPLARLFCSVPPVAAAAAADDKRGWRAAPPALSLAPHLPVASDRDPNVL